MVYAYIVWIEYDKKSTISRAPWNTKFIYNFSVTFANDLYTTYIQLLVKQLGGKVYIADNNVLGCPIIIWL